MHSVDTESIATASERPVATSVGGEVVLLNPETGTYQGLTGVGPRIWEMIQEPTSVGTIVDSVADEYDVATETCEEDVLDFVRELAAEGLVEIDDRPGA